MRWFRTKFFAFQVLRKIVIQISLILFNVFSFVCVSHEPSLIDVFRTHKIIIAVLAVVALVMAIVHIIFAFKNKPFEIDSEQGVHLISGLIDIFKFAVLLILLICCIITLRG